LLQSGAIRLKVFVWLRCKEKPGRNERDGLEKVGGSVRPGAAGYHVHPKEAQAELGYTSSPPHLMRTYASGDGAILLLLDYAR